MSETIDFLTLYEKIFSILPNGTLQELMDVCYEVTQVPILIVDITYNVLGIAPKKPTGDYLWDYLLEHRTYGADKVSIMFEDHVIQSVDENKAPYVIDWGSQKDHPKIQGIVRINDNVEAYVTMNCTGCCITPDKLKAMDIIQSACAWFFREPASEGNMSCTYQKVFMTELMNGRIKTDDQLTRWFKDMNFRIEPPYVVTAISANEENGRLILSLIKKSLQSLHQSQLMLIKHDILYILHFEGSPLQKKSYMIAMEDILGRLDCRCGASMEFDSLLAFSDHRHQADAALSIGQDLYKDKRMYIYQDLMLPAVFLEKVKEGKKEDYVPKVLYEIKQYDDKNSTEFFPTLRAYISHMQDTADTAAALHIHRNTLGYRINKIEELFGVSLKDYRTCFHFMVAFYMLELDQRLHLSN